MSEFVCPVTRQPLTLVRGDGEYLVAPDGRRYPVRGGIPELVDGASRQRAGPDSGCEYSAARAREYDVRIEVLFRTFGADESAVRDELVALLRLVPEARVLEVGCGTCRDTIHLARRAGLVYATDLSREMIEVGRGRLAEAGVPEARVRLFVADALALPCPDDFFDAAYHFGALNVFSDRRRALAELARVVRPGGRVVVGDEGLGPWLEDTEFGRILVNSNPLYRHGPPLALLPAAAREVACRWILGGAFYVIDFTVGEGEPPLDLDVEFPGWRGGTHRTRYYGRLEGVSPALRQRVIDAAAREGLSVAAWLERTLHEKLSGS